MKIEEISSTGIVQLLNKLSSPITSLTKSVLRFVGIAYISGFLIIRFYFLRYGINPSIPPQDYLPAGVLFLLLIALIWAGFYFSRLPIHKIEKLHGRKLFGVLLVRFLYFVSVFWFFTATLSVLLFTAPFETLLKLFIWMVIILFTPYLWKTAYKDKEDVHPVTPVYSLIWFLFVVWFFRCFSITK